MNTISGLSPYQPDSPWALLAAESTSLHVAASWNLESVVDELLRLGVNVDKINKQGNVALHCAARYGYKSIINKLLAFNESPTLRNKNGESALTMAAKGGHMEIIKLFLDLKI